MGIREQRAGKLISYSATALSILLAYGIYSQGQTDPRKYLASMNINHHSSYGGGKGLACSECHTGELTLYGVNLKGGPISCYTSYCHGELLPNYTHEQSVEAYTKSNQDKNFLPYFAAKTEHHLALHKAAQGESCISCHTEHTNSKELIYPEGFVPFESIKAQYSNAPTSLSAEAVQTIASLVTSP